MFRIQKDLKPSMISPPGLRRLPSNWNQRPYSTTCATANSSMKCTLRTRLNSASMYETLTFGMATAPGMEVAASGGSCQHVHSYSHHGVLKGNHGYYVGDQVQTLIKTTKRIQIWSFLINKWPKP